MKPRTTVDLLEPGTKVDPYSETTIADWSVAPTVHAGIPAAVEPQATSENSGADTAIVSRWTCYLPPDTTIAETWRVRWLGRDHFIEGDIADWRGARTSYLQATLKRVSH